MRVRMVNFLLTQIIEFMITSLRQQLENPQAAFFALWILSLTNPVLALVVCAIAMCVIYDRYLDGRYTTYQLRVLVICFGCYSVSGAFFVLEALTR